MREGRGRGLTCRPSCSGLSPGLHDEGEEPVGEEEEEEEEEFAV